MLEYEDMFYYLYRITEFLTPLHQVARLCILHVEVPLLSFIIRLTGALECIPRNSILESTRFNLFMSDLDFTVVATEDQFARLYRTRGWLKFIFLNLGEFEFYLPDEWKELTRLQREPSAAIWDKLYLIRKTRWQRRQLEKTQGSYERTKLERSLRQTLTKYKQKSFPLNGSDIFHDLPVEQTKPLSLPHESKFLEHIIDLKSHPEALVFHSITDAQKVLAILPDTNLLSSLSVLREAKLHVIQREYFLTLTSLRLKKITNPSADYSIPEGWLKNLSAKLVEYRR